MNILQSIEQNVGTDRTLNFAPGDDVRVHVQIKDGEKSRTQIFEGIVISIKGTGSRTMFVVRKMSFGVGVERIFPLHSPSVEKVEVRTHHAVRRSRLYYLRDLKGKAARLKEVAPSAS